MSAPLRILYIAYPLLPISDASCGGAEQVLLTLEREMARRRHSTVVAAAARSQISGELYPTGAPASGPDQLARRDAEHNRRILQLLAADQDFDLVHDMSGTFWKRAGETELPVLATLHLPPVLYAPEMFENIAPNVFFNCVSQSQARHFSHLPQVLWVVPNGINLDQFARGDVSSNHLRAYLLWLGRICEEKAPHLALEVAERAGLPLVLAGSVYPFSYHQEYFRSEIAPRLARNSQARFIDSPGFSQKLQLLRHARAVLLTSLIDETSSLVAMEAAACGTPVVALRKGAIPEVVADGHTGWLLNSIEQMLAAVERLGDIDPGTCCQHAQLCFSAARMADDYECIYERVLKSAPRARPGLQAA